jgi:hypothetical protein
VEIVEGVEVAFTLSSLVGKPGDEPEDVVVRDKGDSTGITLPPAVTVVSPYVPKWITFSLPSKFSHAR